MHKIHFILQQFESTVNLTNGNATQNILEKKSYGGYSFYVDSDQFVVVYIDGSSKSSNNASAGYGVFFDENHAL